MLIRGLWSKDGGLVSQPPDVRCPEPIGADPERVLLLQVGAALVLSIGPPRQVGLRWVLAGHPPQRFPARSLL